MNNMTVAYVGLGSNMGDSKKLIKAIVEGMANHESFCMPILSPLYKTSPVGDEDQADFINAVVKVDTDLSADKLLKFLLIVEKRIGRERDAERPKGPRVIDCDLLLYGREVIDTKQLVIPHPRMTERLFVMQPLVDVAPKAMIMGSGYAAEVLAENEEKGVYKSQTVEEYAD